MLRFAPREADVEKLRGGGWAIDGRVVEVNVMEGSFRSDRGAEERSDRRDREVERVENDDICAVRLGVRRSDLSDVISSTGSSSGCRRRTYWWMAEQALAKAWSRKRI